jgi:hypothetical protein
MNPADFDPTSFFLLATAFQADDVMVVQTGESTWLTTNG